MLELPGTAVLAPEQTTAGGTPAGTSQGSTGLAALCPGACTAGATSGEAMLCTPGQQDTQKLAHQHLGRAHILPLGEPCPPAASTHRKSRSVHLPSGGFARGWTGPVPVCPSVVGALLPRRQEWRWQGAAAALGVLVARASADGKGMGSGQRRGSAGKATLGDDLPTRSTAPHSQAAGSCPPGRQLLRLSSCVPQAPPGCQGGDAGGAAACIRLFPVSSDLALLNKEPGLQGGDGNPGTEAGRGRRLEHRCCPRAGRKALAGPGGVPAGAWLARWAGIRGAGRLELRLGQGRPREPGVRQRVAGQRAWRTRGRRRPWGACTSARHTPASTGTAQALPWRGGHTAVLCRVCGSTLCFSSPYI